MADGTNQDVGTGATPGAATQATQTVQATQTSQATSDVAGKSGPKALDSEMAEASARELAILARKNKELTERLEAIEAEKLAEQGKFKELYESEKAAREKERAEMRRRAARADIRSYATSLGAIDPDVADLISLRELKLDEETGEYTNVQEVVARHRESKPHLYSRAAANGSQDAGAAGTNSTPPVSTGSGGKPPESSGPKQKPVAEMSRDEYAEAKQKLLRDLRNGKRA